MLLIACLPLTPALEGQQIPSREPVPMLSGALIADSFDGTQLHANV